MDSLIDFEITGEIFIPIEMDKQHQPITLQNLIQLNYSNFRKILFQGELAKMYIVLRTDSKNISNLKDLFDRLYIKIEFESIEHKDDNSEEDFDKTLTDLFSINSSKINPNNYDYDPISHKSYYDQSNTAIFEVFKHIIVPQRMINVDLLMKVELMTKNENKFAENMHPIDYFRHGYFNTIQAYRKIKTLFKETKIIRPLKIRDIKQTDVLLDTSLLQAKIENTTAGINFIDESLKASKFLIKETNNSIRSSSTNLFSCGMNISINDIEILKEETTFDEQNTQHMKHIKDLYMKNDKVSLSNMIFSLFNRDLPIVISGGEEMNLTIKVVKSVFLSEKSDKDNESTLVNEKESLIQDTFSQKGSTVLLTAPNVSSSSTPLQAARETVQIPTQAKDFPILSNVKNTVLNTQGKTEEESVSKIESISENYKICFITPIIINLSSSLFFDNLYLCLPMKWSNEINRFLKVEINIPDDIILHESFNISLKILNISANEMNLNIEVNDNFDEIKQANNEDIEIREKPLDTIPSIISQTKIQNFGNFNCNEDKVFQLSFLPLKNGFIPLPNFTITDLISGKRFLFVPSNKIFVKENNK